MRNCKDCEPAQESHFVAYTSVVMGFIDEPFFRLMEGIFGNTVDKIANKFSLSFFNLMVALGLGRFSYAPEEKDNTRTKCFWEEAKRRGIKMREFHMGFIHETFIAEYEGKRIQFDGLPRKEDRVSRSLRWMDDKGVMKAKFQKEGLPVARGGVAFTKRGALKIWNNINKPVITKPNVGSRSRHTTIHINTIDELILGFRKAKKISPLVVIEEELRGSLFRGTLIDKKLVAVVRRDPPGVTCDGIRTVAELLEEENKRPERNGPIFHKIVIDKEAEKELKRQNVKMEDVPPKGTIVTFSQKTSRGSGGSTTEVTDTVHPDNVAMLEHVGAFLNDSLVGVDFVIEDITKSWKEEKIIRHSGIIECNSLPFIDLHHYPMFGKPVNVAGKLWDLVLPTRESSLKMRE